MGISERRRSMSDINMGGVLRVPTCIFLLCATVLTRYAAASEPRVVCYYTNWSVYRPGTARFNPQNINPYLCTHLIYAFGGFTKDNTLKPFDKYQDIEKGGYAKFTGLKTYNNRLKTLLAIGGWNEGSTRFSPMVASRERRKEFVRNAIKFLRQNRFDGLDLDWEYPAFRDGGKPKDRENYSKLVKELREEFEKESQKTGKPRLLLTMAVPAGIEYIQKGFDVKTLNRYLDWMNLLSYDYHSAFEPAVNHHAPLYPLEEPNEYSVDSELNIDYTIQYYLENGADRDKIVLGIPTYGRSYTLFNPDATEIGAPADGPGEQGEATREKGYLAYYEICEALKEKPKKKRSTSDDEDDEDSSSEDEEEEEDLPWTVVQPNPNAMGPVAYRGNQWTVVQPNPNAMGPVAYRGNQWVGYDDIDIVKKKADYVAEKGLGGIMFWSIDNDDFRGNCHGKPYPLIEAAKEAYIARLGITDNAITSEKQSPSSSSSSSRRRNRPKVISTTAAPPSTSSSRSSSNKRTKPSTSAPLSSSTPSWSTPEPPTTPDPGSDFKCKDEGFFPHPRDCKKYFWCLDSGPSNLGIVAHAFTCPSGLFFNKLADSCDFARNVLCKISASTTTTTTSKPHSTSTNQPRTSTTSRPPAVTTTRRPNKLTSKSSVYFRTTTTTVTPVLDDDEVYEDEIIDDADASEVEAEDPKVIKELIDLIKKAGGVEQLEKHLKLSEESASVAAGTTTALPIPKKLYQKVLENAKRGSNSFLDRYNTVSRDVNGGGAQNSRGSPQNAGLESAPEAASLRKERPQYTTINRSRPSATTTEEAQESREEPVAQEDEPKESAYRTRTLETTNSARPLPQYVNIRRARPSTEKPDESDDDDSASRNALFERNGDASFVSTVSVTEYPSSPSPSGHRRDTPEYVTIKRSRPTTVETTTAKYQSILRERPVYEEEEEEGENVNPPTLAAPQFSTIQRSPPATTPHYEELLISREPTTILAVQISSLVNSPVTSEPEVPVTDPKVPNPTVPVSSESPVTTPSTTTAVPSSSSTPRRSILKRIRSTTTTTTASPTSTVQQVSSERTYTFVRRRRPNDISSDPNDTEGLRKVRSTTPDSREAASNLQSDGDVGIVFRGSHNRVIRPTNTENIVTLVASPVQRGRFRPTLSRDEVVSLTPAENENLESVPLERIAPRTERRFRSRVNSVTKSDVTDTEVSAATVEIRGPEFIARGRSRFTATKSAEEVINLEQVSTEAPNVERKRTFSRFTPRPFARFGSTATAQEVPISAINDLNFTDAQITVSSSRTPSRLPFGRIRPTTPRTVVPQARIVSPLLRRGSSTTLASVNEDIADDESELKVDDDIDLSESSIEEKEHEDTIAAEAEEKPRRRIVVKKIRPSVVIEVENIDDITSTSENDIEASSVTPGEDAGRERKLKVIRRRPTSTTVSATTEPVTLPSSTEATHYSPVANRIRKIVRKKILPALAVTEEDDNMEQQKEVEDDNGSIILNYGDKAEPVIFSAKTQNIKNESASAITSEISLITTTTTHKTIEGNVTETVEETTPFFQETNSTSTTEQSLVMLSSSETPDNVEVGNANESVIEENSEVSESTEPTAKASTSSSITRSRFERPQYRHTKRPFSPSTEATVAASSRTYSRKYNAGSYTSPSSVAEVSDKIRSPVTRRPLFTSKPFSRRPFTTARTTKKIEDEDYSDEELESDEIIEEPDSKLVFADQLYTRGGQGIEHNQDTEETAEEDISKEEDEVKLNRPTSRKPFFKPKAVNSNTFRTSTTTTEIPKVLTRFQNRTSLYNKFGRPGSAESKKRVQNVPVHHQNIDDISDVSFEDEDSGRKSENSVVSTTYATAETDQSTTDDDYLTATSEGDFTESDNTNTYPDVTSTNTETEPTATESMEFDISTDDYLESTEETQEPISTENPTTVSQHVFSDTQPEYSTPTTQSSTIKEASETVKSEITTTTSTSEVTPVVETHFDKLFSVSRVVEVSSKLDKHRLNKNNESRLIESGHIMQEKKPTIDKIGEVSRFTLIKIVKDDIPIYLTKLGHVYPVANPPDNPIRIDEGRNARALMNFTDSGRENLVASESVNEAYRHVNKVEHIMKIPMKVKSQNPLIEMLKEDNFQVLNKAIDSKEELKTEKSNALFPVQWQFVPAAFENENEKSKQNKAAKSFDVITPRSYKTDPSTIALEGLFKTENPLLLVPRKVSTFETPNNQPFVVYAAPRAVDDDTANFVKLQVLKAESGRNVKTYARGQEFSGITSIQESNTDKNPITIKILASESEERENETITMTDNMYTTTETVDNETTLNYITTTILTTLATTETNIKTTTVTTETATEPEITTLKIPISNDALSEIAKKRPKLTFPRRSNFRNTNITRVSISPLSNQGATPRTPKKNNSTIININQKTNRTTGFNPNKSRFTANRSQNVPVDIRNDNKNKPGQAQSTTESTRTQPASGDSSRKLYFKPIRPNLVRPSFVPRKSSTQAPTQAPRRNFLRRTKPTEQPSSSTEASRSASIQEATTTRETTRKFLRRGPTKFEKKRTQDKSNLPEITYSPSKVSRSPAEIPEASRPETEKRPSLNENVTAQTTGAEKRPTRTYVRRRYTGVNATTTAPTPSTATRSPSPSDTTRRPAFRVATRRRTAISSTVAPTTIKDADTTPAPTTTVPDIEKHDLAVQESVEKENNDQSAPRTRPSIFKKTIKIQRRPLTSLKEPTTPVTEEPKKRESKKYSASFKQNQLDEVIRQKSTESKSEESTEPLEQLSVDTAIAIAAHQLLGAPLPSTPNYEGDQYYTPTSSQKYSSSSAKIFVGPSTEPYTGYANSKDYSPGSTGFPSIFTSRIVNPEASSTPRITSSPEISSSTGFYSSSGISSSPSPVYTRGSVIYNAPPASGYNNNNGWVPTTNKYVSVPIDDFGYTANTYNGGLNQEPVYFTRDYLMESPATTRYETDYQYLSPITTEAPASRAPKRPTSAFRRISTTNSPSSKNIVILPPTTPQPRRIVERVKAYDKIPMTTEKKVTYRPLVNYDYYDDGDEKLLDRYPENDKVIVHGKGNIECLDQGNFPHPSSCRKFIICARMEGGTLIGWEYVCPQGLSYDPVGGICNWSAGLGCNES